MPRRIDQNGRSIPNIAVPVQRLGIARLRYDGVGLDEAAYVRIEVPRIEVIQPDCSIFPLSCKAPRGRCRAGGDARLAPGSTHRSRPSAAGTSGALARGSIYQC